MYFGGDIRKIEDVHTEYKEYYEMLDVMYEGHSFLDGPENADYYDAEKLKEKRMRENADRKLKGPAQ